MGKPAAPPLGFIAPMLPTLVDEPPEGAEWVHEIKYDGYRAQIIIQNETARVFTRNGHDWTDKLWPIAQAAEKLPAFTAIIDGELIVTNDQGKPDFGSIRNTIRTAPGRLAFVAFDLLYWNGKDFRDRSLIDRRRGLWSLVEPAEGRIQYSHHVEADGAAFFAAVDEMGLEGMVSKRADSHYRSGRVRNWLKIKCYEERDFEVAGVLREPGEAPMALMVTPGERKYVGSAFLALNREMRERLWARVKAGGGTAPAGVKKPKAQWAKPGLIGRVRYLKGEEKLRHATLKELRED
jgi:bifunctional non-homologous end joining protein LigD